MTWLLCDYGEVLCRPQPATARAAIEAAAGWDRAVSFWTVYWEHRPGYDRGDLDARGYWAAVLGRAPAPGQLDRLVALDVASWLHPDEEALAAAERAAGRGLQLALLSNAPREVAAGIDAVSWLAGFAPRLFSCDLGAVKPEPAAYRAALRVLGAPAGDVWFLDDRPANVEGARAAGMRAERFEGPEQIDAVQP